MALTDAELLRMQAMESLLNDWQTVVNNLASKKQMAALMLVKQTEIDALKQRVTNLETQIAVLQSKLT